LAGIDAFEWVQQQDKLTEFKGAYIENYSCNVLQTLAINEPRYWVSEGTAEVDFIIQHQGYIYPIEVKSTVNIKSKSLQVYAKNYQPRLKIRLSRKNLKLDGQLLNIPLFYAERILEFIGNAEKES